MLPVATAVVDDDRDATRRSVAAGGRPGRRCWRRSISASWAAISRFEVALAHAERRTILGPAPGCRARPRRSRARGCRAPPPCGDDDVERHAELARDDVTDDHAAPRDREHERARPEVPSAPAKRSPASAGRRRSPLLLDPAARLVLVELAPLVGHDRARAAASAFGCAGTRRAGRPRASNASS